MFYLYFTFRFPRKKGRKSSRRSFGFGPDHPAYILYNGHLCPFSTCAPLAHIPVSLLHRTIFRERKQTKKPSFMKSNKTKTTSNASQICQFISCPFEISLRVSLSQTSEAKTHSQYQERYHSNKTTISFWHEGIQYIPQQRLSFAV